MQISAGDLRSALRNHADLSDADLRGADLRGTDLSRTHINDVDMTGAHLTDARLPDLTTMINVVWPQSTQWGSYLGLVTERSISTFADEYLLNPTGGAKVGQRQPFSIGS